MKPIAMFPPTFPKSAGTQHPPNHPGVVREMRMLRLCTPKDENGANPLLGQGGADNSQRLMEAESRLSPRITALRSAPQPPPLSLGPASPPQFRRGAHFRRGQNPNVVQVGVALLSRECSPSLVLVSLLPSYSI